MKMINIPSRCPQSRATEPPSSAEQPLFSPEAKVYGQWTLTEYIVGYYKSKQMALNLISCRFRILSTLFSDIYGVSKYAS